MAFQEGGVVQSLPIRIRSNVPFSNIIGLYFGPILFSQGPYNDLPFQTFLFSLVLHLKIDQG